MAAQLFEVSGYAATTMADIAKAAGVLPGSLYYHFASKEEIAVEILAELDRDLNALAATVSRHLSATGDGPEDRVRYLAEEVTALSVRRGAALRLYSYEAPSAATERFRAALRLQAPALEKVWKRALDGLVPKDSPNARDLGLLRFALHRLTLHATINLPGRTDARYLARQICDLLLHGMIIDCPDDRALDASEAVQAAQAAIDDWPPPPRPTGSGSREDIIAAARTEFARRGYNATTIRDVAEAAGVRMGTLYRRVDSKEEILSEILQSYSGHMDRALRSALTAGTSVAAAVDAFTLVLVHAKRRFREETDIVKFGSRGDRPANAPFEEYFKQTQARLRLLEQVLARGIAERSVRPIGAPAELGLHVRSIAWVPYQDFARSGVPRTHRFLRNSLLRGFVNAPAGASA